MIVAIPARPGDAKEDGVNILDLDGIALSPEAVARRLRFGDEALLRRLIEKAQSAVSPRAVYRAGFIDEKREDRVIIEGVLFISRVLRRNLDPVGRVFPFVLTLGKAADDLIDESGDLLEKYLLDQTLNLILRKARRRLEQHLCSTFALGNISSMSPGSLPDWPIEQQQPLFRLLPGVEDALGVRLTETFLILPRKSVSGVYFPSETTFLSCQLCPRDRCDSRKAAFDLQKARDYGVHPERKP